MEFEFPAFFNFWTPFWMLPKSKSLHVEKAILPANFELKKLKIGGNLLKLWSFTHWQPPFWIVAPSCIFSTILYSRVLRKGSKNLNKKFEPNRYTIAFFRAKTCFGDGGSYRRQQWQICWATSGIRFYYIHSTIISNKITFHNNSADNRLTH